MKLVENLIVALSMYSKIPMPHIEWTKENMRYALCFFPVVGVAVGAVVRLWYDISVLLSVGVLLRTAILVLIPVLIFLGCAAKQSAVIKDKFIPALLAAAGVLLAGLYVLATTTLVAQQDVAQAVFTALVQGLLCAAGAVYADQIVKQAKKSE